MDSLTGTPDPAGNQLDGGEEVERVLVVSGGNPRTWSVDEKLAIVAESYSAMTSISEVARRHQLNRNQPFQWRAQFRRGDLGGPVVEPFIPLTISDVSEPVDRCRVVHRVLMLRPRKTKRSPA
ncbi:MAG: transposase [Telmatospirillum sp.]|nr:transposase [Telmatospirillum sp.]